MENKDRIDNLLKHLRLSARKLSILLGLNNPQIFYDIKSGKCGISTNLANRIQEKFPEISKSWLLTGEGEMLIGNITQSNNGVANVIGDNHINNNLSDELSLLIKNQIEQLKKKDEQIDRLISIIENFKK